MMNWSAKDGARSSPHYGGEGVSIHPSHQGVCRRHGTEEPHVTPGGLARSSAGTDGDCLRARSSSGQRREAVLACHVLNRMTELDRPVSYRIGR